MIQLLVLLFIGYLMWCLVKNIIGAQHRSGHGR